MYGFKLSFNDYTSNVKQGIRSENFDHALDACCTDIVVVNYITADE